MNTYDNYADFARENEPALLESAAAAINPDLMGMTREQALTLAGALKNCGFTREDYAEIMAKSSQDKGTFAKQWERFKGTGKNGECGAGTIFQYAQASGWKWPSPSEISEDMKESARKREKRMQAKPAISKEASDSFKLVCIMDNHKYKEKPANVGAIRNREQTPTPRPKPLTMREFAEAIASGRTFSPTVYNKVQTDTDANGRPKFDYIPIEQQIFVVDIDNETLARDAGGRVIKDANGKSKKRRIDNYLTIEAAEKICNDNDIKPFLIYETFSSKEHRNDEKEPYNKFRICFALDKPLTARDWGERGLNEVKNYFIKLFGDAADSGTDDTARLIYGTDEKDRTILYNNVVNSEKLITKIEEAKRNPETAEKFQINENASGEQDLDEFFETVTTDRYKPQPTGIDKLDDRLAGGFINEWLVIISAPPGAGKTVFASQICENIARAGRKCLYFNFEMSKEQLIARSLARINAGKDGINAMDILRLYEQSEERKQLIYKAGLIYKQHIAPNMLYNPDGCSPNIDQICEVMEARARRAESEGEPAPIVCIDYLQLIEGAPREDVKETIKRAVYAFKQYAEQHRTIVLCISAQSRAANGDTEARQDAGRDTSNIEYSADLQLQILSDKDDPQRIKQIYITKCRFAAPSLRRYLEFEFLGAQGRFKYIGEGDAKQNTGKPGGRA